MPEQNIPVAETVDDYDGSDVLSDLRVSQKTIVETRLHFLKTLTLCILDEINSLESPGGWSKVPKFVLKNELRHFEVEIIRKALASTRGAQRRAARLLGMNATTLNAKIKQFGVNHKTEESGFSFESVRNTLEIGDPEGCKLVNFNDAMVDFEVELIKRALERSGGNQTKAARSLGIPLTTLNYKIKKHNINPLDFPIHPPSPLVLGSSDVNCVDGPMS